MAKVTIKQCIEALVKHDGFQSMAADELGISRGTLSMRIKNNPKLQQVLKDIKESILDEVEGQLIKNAKSTKYKDNQRAIEFYMRHQGKKRGYAEKAEVSISEDSKPLEIIYKKPAFSHIQTRDKKKKETRNEGD